MRAANAETNSMSRSSDLSLIACRAFPSVVIRHDFRTDFRQWLSAARSTLTAAAPYGILTRFPILPGFSGTLICFLFRFVTV